MSPKEIIKHLIIISISLFTGSCLGKEATVPDDHRLAHVHSDQGRIDRNHNVTYSGHVIATQGSRQLIANKLVILRTKAGKVKQVVATGIPAKYQYKRITDKKNVYMHANTITYDPSKTLFTFTKNVWINEAGNIFQGEYSTYNSKTEHIYSEPRNHERSKMILQPFDQTPNTGP